MYIPTREYHYYYIPENNEEWMYGEQWQMLMHVRSKIQRMLLCEVVGNALESNTEYVVLETDG